MVFHPNLLMLVSALTVAPCHGHGGYHEEIARCDERITADPDNAELWFHRGRLDYLHGDWMRSILDLENAERLAPGEYPVALARGQAWMAGGKLQAARKALDEFVKSHPDVPEGFATRARLMIELEDPAAAADDFQQALAKTKSPEPDLYIETANALISCKHSEEAVKVLQAGILKLGAIPSLSGKALDVEQSLGLYDAALSRVATLQRSASRPELWMAKRASILAQAGRLDESQTAWIALRDHLLALPANERSSHAMSVFLEQARNAIESLAHPPTNSPSEKPTPSS